MSALLRMPVLESPPAAAVRHDFEVNASADVDTARLLAGGSVAPIWARLRRWMGRGGNFLYLGAGTGGLAPSCPLHWL